MLNLVWVCLKGRRKKCQWGKRNAVHEFRTSCFFITWKPNLLRHAWNLASGIHRTISRHQGILSDRNVLVSHEDSFWLTSMIGFCVPHGQYREIQLLRKNSLEWNRVDIKQIQDLLSLYFCIFIKLAFIQWPDQSNSLPNYTHICNHLNSVSCLSSPQKVIWPWNHIVIRQPPSKHTHTHTHAYQSPGNVNQALLSTLIMYYWTLSQCLVGDLGPFNSVTCVSHGYLERH